MHDAVDAYNAESVKPRPPTADETSLAEHRA